MTTPAGNYIVLGQPPHHVNIWWDQKNPDSIHLTSSDPGFTDEDGGKPGFRVVFSSNPRSADYSPANFNRCSRALAASGKSAPAEVPVLSRKLADRPAVIAQLSAQPISSTASLGALGLEICGHCRSAVADLEAHRLAVPVCS
jgi:hypothetical protein